MNAITQTNFHFEKQTGFYRGKVRDVYFFEDQLLVVASDRISAFDVVLPDPIPDKGRVEYRAGKRTLCGVSLPEGLK